MLIDNQKLIRETMVDFVKYAKEMGVKPEGYGIQNQTRVQFGELDGLKTSPYSLHFNTQERTVIVDFLVYGKDEKGNLCHSFKIYWFSRTDEPGVKEYRYSEFDYDVYGTDLSDEEVDKIIEVLKENNLQSIISAWSYSLYNS